MATDITTEVESIEKAIERDLIAAFKSRTVSNPGATTLNASDLNGVADGYDRRETHVDLEDDMRTLMAKHATRSK